MIRIGMLGADSSHTEVYAGLMNPAGSYAHGRARVVKLWGHDADQAHQKAGAFGIEVVSSPEEAVQGVDLVMVCSRWGDDHYPLARAALEAGVPTYIDKPLTNSLAEARNLLTLAEARSVPAFSCSPYRHAPEVLDLGKRLPELGAFRSGAVAGLSAWPPLGPRAENVYFYGIHPADILHTLFGPGVAAVRAEQGPYAVLAAVRYRDGRQIALHLLRDCEEVYHASYYGADGWAQVSLDPYGAFYQNNLDAVLGMAETGEPPIPLADGVEVIGLLDSVERALESGGWVDLERIGE